MRTFERREYLMQIFICLCCSLQKVVVRVVDGRWDTFVRSQCVKLMIFYVRTTYCATSTTAVVVVTPWFRICSSVMLPHKFYRRVGAMTYLVAPTVTRNSTTLTRWINQRHNLMHGLQLPVSSYIVQWGGYKWVRPCTYGLSCHIAEHPLRAGNITRYQILAWWRESLNIGLLQYRFQLSF